MTEVKILNTKFEETSKETLELSLEPKLINVPVVHQVVKATLANQKARNSFCKDKKHDSGWWCKTF